MAEDKNTVEEIRKRALDKAYPKEEEGGEVEETETETVEEDVAPDAAPEMDAAGGGVPPQVIEALEGLPLPALDAVAAEIDRIRAEKGGGDEMGGDAMGAGGDMGAAPPMPMPGM
tara:strand:- start:2493 stop:2837 length:345 start_codon:yes stop_codon:yes gene_type:complete